MMLFVSDFLHDVPKKLFFKTKKVLNLERGPLNVGLFRCAPPATAGIAGGSYASGQGAIYQYTQAKRSALQICEVLNMRRAQIQ